MYQMMITGPKEEMDECMGAHYLDNSVHVQGGGRWKGVCPKISTAPALILEKRKCSILMLNYVHVIDD